MLRANPENRKCTARKGIMAIKLCNTGTVIALGIVHGSYVTQTLLVCPAAAQ